MIRVSHRLAGLILIVLSIAPASAMNDPVQQIVAERFSFTERDHQVTTLYETSHLLDGRHAEITRLVFMVHGILRNADVYHAMLKDAYRLAGEPAHVAIISPQFLTAEDIEAFGLDDDVPYWTRGGWSAGHLSRSDGELARPVRISSYAVLDRMLERSLRSFPSLKEVVIAGHSAGGQFVNRYAAGNRVHDVLERRGIDLTYVIANPSSYLYFCEHRPVSHDPIEFAPIGETDHADCEGYDRYRYGLSSLNAYMRASGPENLAERYGARRVIYFLGEADNNPEDRYLARGCAAMAQGAHRLERGIAYYHYMAFLLGPDVRKRHELITVPDVAHSSRGMYTSRKGLAILFGKAHDAAGGAQIE